MRWVWWKKKKAVESRTIELGRDFIANASHELRTPVTIIKGFAETLRDIPEMPQEMFDSILEKILRNCERMESLVKNLLVLADLDHLGEIKKESCSLPLLIEDCSYQILNIFPQVYIETLQSEGDLTVQGGFDLLELAIMNLLQNSVKYSAPGKVPHITVMIEKKETGVLLSIEDQGVGIAKENLPHIFNRFYTVNKSHSRKLGGAGLGLSMVKIILEKHGATVQVDSEVGKGTKFSILFPQWS